MRAIFLPATSATGGLDSTSKCGGEQHGVLYGARHDGREGGNRPGQRIWKLLLSPRSAVWARASLKRPAHNQRATLSRDFHALEKVLRTGIP
jgi:hypothetical protein